MAHQLLIRILEHRDQESGSLMAEWGLIHPELKRLMDVSITPLTSIKATLESKYASLLLLKTIVLVPGQQVVLNAVSIPSKQNRQIQQALPYVLEEGIANEIEDNFFALGPRDKDGKLHVAVVSHQSMQHWLSELKQSQLKADILLPETLLIPADNNRNTLVVGEHNSWLRQGPYQGLRFNNALTTTVFKSLGEDTMSKGFSLMSAGSEVAKKTLEYTKNILDAYYDSQSNTQDQLSVDDEQSEAIQDGETIQNTSDLIAGGRAQNQQAKIHLQPHHFSPLYAFAEEVLAGNATVLNQFNLLQGQYKAKGPGVSLGFKWKPLATAASICFICLLSLQLMYAAD